MNELVNIVVLNLGIVLIGLLAYLWGVATKEVRYERKIKELEAQQQRYVSPALRSYRESR